MQLFQRLETLCRQNRIQAAFIFFFIVVAVFVVSAFFLGFFFGLGFFFRRFLGFFGEGRIPVDVGCRSAIVVGVQVTGNDVGELAFLDRKSVV